MRHAMHQAKKDIKDKEKERKNISLTGNERAVRLHCV